MTTAAIIHNYPIHYQHLLFGELKRQGLAFEVLFTGAGSGDRIETPPRDQYPCRVGYEGPYERAPRFRIARYVWSSLSEINPEVVVISGYCDTAAWTAWAWARLRRVPRVLWAESNRFDAARHWWKEAPKSLFVRGCSAADVYGQANRDYLAGLGMPAERISLSRAIANPGLFGGDFAPAGRPQSHRTLLYVGRFSPEKNLEFLLRAVAALEQDPGRPALVLTLVGYGPLEAPLKKLAKELQAEAFVQFRGAALQSELAGVYRKGDALILPSLHETWGLVVLEAMACGLPALVSRRCGCERDLVTPETGWSFDPFDQAALTALLRQFLATPRAELERMGERGARLARKFTPEAAARTVISTIGRVRGGSPAARAAGGGAS